MIDDPRFDGWWEGVIIYSCDNCHKKLEIPFSDEEEFRDYAGHRKTLKEEGWIITKVNGRYVDTCCEKCRNEYIRKNTI